jgi:hypothetical protein
MGSGTLDLNGLPQVPLASLGGGPGGVLETSSGTSQLVVSPSGTSTNFESSIVNGGGLDEDLLKDKRSDVRESAAPPLSQAQQYEGR